MAEQTLPPVAGKIYIECKKCAAERYHTVLAHTTSTSAKVECEICKSKKTYKLPTAAKRKGNEAGIAALKGAALKRKAASLEAKSNAHKNEFNTLVAAANGEASAYNMKTKFGANQKVKHSKFGMGVIRSVQPDKIEVVFEDEVRMLVHNRQ